MAAVNSAARLDNIKMDVRETGREREREGAWGGSCSEQINLRAFMNMVMSILDLFPQSKDKDVLILFNLLST
jgi:hypothetical protein